MAEHGKCQSGTLTRCLILVLGIWSWMGAVPRVMLRLATYMLDLLESTTLAILWKYQGDNVLKFLYEQKLVTQNTAKAGHTYELRNQTVQTDDHTYLAREHMERRSLVLDKLIEDLLPELLKALHEIPPRKVLEQNFVEQNTQIRSISDQHQEMLVLLQQMCPVFATSDSENRLAVQLLTAKIEAVDRRLDRILERLEEVSKATRHRDGQLAPFTDGIDILRSNQEADAVVVSQSSESDSRPDSALTETNTGGRSALNCFADATTETGDISLDLVHQSHVSDSYHKKVAGFHINAVSPDVDLSGSQYHPAPPVDTLSLKTPTKNEMDSVESEATTERLHALTASKETGPIAVPASAVLFGENAFSAVNTKPRRFSIRRGLKQRSWFGKKSL
ncbi:hypothetical protein COEREDRAFT_86325 [Coemansia reversa NRRL 1564]|uniref:Uncharacterized protein n=1 Tax=Coemansia reversa (strain ATCC 12441 / NRRL 1564) TaxID=763665 RepID=A0A2G5BEA3_COERN|nr:hypothetical protein COEREDRAFT_86325 [Coemansia reversa NRRL 1564]|eukprot:PIA17334.1 hypothetical protein COEREDRAFT_86325 [Coemansia reversa NRRL 1564]